MVRDIPTRRLNLIILLSLLFLVIELLGSGSGRIIGVAILIFMMYIGWKQYETSVGKLICWIGIIGFVIQVLSLFAVQFFVIAFLVLLVLEYKKQKKEPQVIAPQMSDSLAQKKSVIQSSTLLPHRLIGTQTTQEEPYQWRDINIQTGIGSKVIDLSNTVIRDTAVVSIRHLIGPVTILVPYDLDLQIVHSAMYGRLQIFSEPEHKLLNETVMYETQDYAAAKMRVKIITTVISGDVEVKRV
ncbi:cell wall-active antibiotics response protein LiaF [Alkalicoccus daliensis]|uniref:Lia operon protein LiaF n=1 Tax=Alkalicoccus daliensis TaxID=745820 RepID=A0A1H0CL41_9BACI|nr:cell wall-active antibiotics response protein LiaF [Alkalicoccus daliensis]SDN58563.1 lia operon protein LiaF [Alkalicoccus daliensis]